MNLELNFSSSIQARLNHFAAVTGKSVDTLIVEAVEVHFAEAVPEEAITKNLRHSDWAGALRDWSNSHPQRDNHVDDSRDGIYESREF